MDAATAASLYELLKSVSNISVRMVRDEAALHSLTGYMKEILRERKRLASDKWEAERVRLATAYLDDVNDLLQTSHTVQERVLMEIESVLEKPENQALAVSLLGEVFEEEA
jgi:allophanate hydrolase subunit 1